MQDIARLIAEATHARARLLDRIRRLASMQEVFKPGPAEWSVAENVEHLVLAEQGSINRVWAAADGLRRGGLLDGRARSSREVDRADRRRDVDTGVAGPGHRDSQAPRPACLLGRRHPVQSAVA